MAVLLAAGGAPAAVGQVVYEDDPFRFVKWPVEDAKALWQGARSRQALYAAGVGGVLLLASPFDDDLTEPIRDSRFTSRRAVRVFEEMGNVKMLRPAAVVLFAGSLFSGNTRFQDAAFTSLEAIVYANLITNTLKLVTGRARPEEDAGPTRFRPFSSDRSFPSGHATTAFAMTTPWVLYYPGALTPGLLLFGVSAGYARILDEKHWITDVLAGSAIGFATAYWLTRRHQNPGVRLQLSPTLGLDHVGVKVRF